MYKEFIIEINLSALKYINGKEIKMFQKYLMNLTNEYFKSKHKRFDLKLKNPTHSGQLICEGNKNLDVYFHVSK